MTTPDQNKQVTPDEHSKKKDQAAPGEVTPQITNADKSKNIPPVNEGQPASPHRSSRARDQESNSPNNRPKHKPRTEGQEPEHQPPPPILLKIPINEGPTAAFYSWYKEPSKHAKAKPFDMAGGNQAGEALFRFLFRMVTIMFK